ncbi:MAG: transcription termination factor NusA [Clostridiales bacterium]|nr:transcription termination factor NusA [Clostridiales bacterium]
MNIELIGAIKQIAKEKKIDEDLIFTALKTSLVAAFKKNFYNQEFYIDIDQDSGVISVYVIKKIVPDDSKNFNIDKEIRFSESLIYSLDSKIGEVVKIDSTPNDFGRMAAQIAKQLISQKLLELERNVIYNKFKEKIGKIVNGIVQSIDDRGNILINLGDTETILHTREQINGEKFITKDRIKVYVDDIKQHSRGVTILVSRSTPNFVKALFEQEIPEISSGIIEIKSISREAGKRTKIALLSKRNDIEAIGACVGENNARINIILKEINGDKIDLINYDKDLSEFIKNSLSPAKVKKVILNESNSEALVITESNQISLAIGRGGQNVRLASKLVGVKLDVKTEEQFEEIKSEIEDD